jgi:hypothetical protein
VERRARNGKRQRLCLWAFLLDCPGTRERIKLLPKGHALSEAPQIQAGKVEKVAVAVKNPTVQDHRRLILGVTVVETVGLQVRIVRPLLIHEKIVVDPGSKSILLANDGDLQGAERAVPHEVMVDSGVETIVHEHHGHQRYAGQEVPLGMVQRDLHLAMSNGERLLPHQRKQSHQQHQ